MAQVDERHEHDPIRVNHTLETDDDGRPARWLWHVECYGCGEILDDEDPTGRAAA